MIANVRSGQLSNRLVSTAYAIATAIEYKRNIRLTEFDDLKDNYICEISWPQRVRIKGSRFWAWERSVFMTVKRWFPRFRIPRVVSDWSYRNENGAERQADKLRRFFAPKESAIEAARKFADKIFDDTTIVIGVHIRRGDYAGWQEGRFFFNDEVYRQNMSSLEEAFAEKGKKVRFVIFSQEPINLENYSIKSDIVKSDCNAVQDHWLMGQCDYLIGPPSTFTLWAAFMGKKLLAFIEDSSARLLPSDFMYHGLKVRC